MLSFSRAVTFSTLYLIYFLDLAGFALALILFSPLFIDSSSPFLAVDTPLATRNLILGLLYAAYPFAQFFGAPFWGEWSDRFGRRPVLLITVLLTAISFAGTALAITYGSLTLLFCSRLVGGFFAGNATVAQASVSDRLTARKKGVYMAAFSMVGGLSWVLAPYVGTLLSDNQLSRWFTSETPFWAIAAILFLALVATFFKVSESIPTLKKRLGSMPSLFLKTCSPSLNFPKSALLLLSLWLSFARGCSTKVLWLPS